MDYEELALNDLKRGGQMDRAAIYAQLAVAQKLGAMWDQLDRMEALFRETFNNPIVVQQHISRYNVPR